MPDSVASSDIIHIENGKPEEMSHPECIQLKKVAESDERTTASETDGTNSINEPLQSTTMSKNQLKKLKRKESWEATKEERRRRQREHHKAKRKRRQEAGEPLGPSRKALKGVTMAGSACRQRLVVDMSFGSYMSERDLSKAIKQVHRCYSHNRRVSHPLQFHITSLAGESLTSMERNNGFRNWDVNITDKPYLDLFDRSDLVYLTSDSENVVEVLDESKVYVIGGLVDHNNHKGLCYKLALENKIAHAKLPIGKFLTMKTRQVLTIDQVFEIMLHVASEGKSWKEAFLSTMPARKGASVKDDDGHERESEGVGITGESVADCQTSS